MQPLSHLLIYWAVAFGTLCVALVLFALFSSLADSDLVLNSLEQEAATALVASLIQAVAFWLIVSFAPGALRAMLLPAVIVGLIYKLMHWRDWNRYEVGGVLLFQLVFCCVSLALATGQFKLATIVAGGFVGALALIANLVRNR